MRRFDAVVHVALWLCVSLGFASGAEAEGNPGRGVHLAAVPEHWGAIGLPRPSPLQVAARDRPRACTERCLYRGVGHRVRRWPHSWDP
ncbi:exported protein of unknown function [Streptantibioticus cattleyicolor NRRL 8057 = DSM 46488]|nr:exported protein of unknown function [Streptantibioticus cattleyicolor NRRL 8057 = DSM 46488]